MENQKICPVCKAEFKDGDSTAACPFCGIQYHLECWKQNHGCIIPGCPGQNTVPQTENSAAVNTEAPVNSENADNSQYPQNAITPAGSVAETPAVQKKKSKKALIIGIIIAVVLIGGGLGGFFTYSAIQSANEAAAALASASKASSDAAASKERAFNDYITNAKQFAIDVLATGADMEDIGNKISEYWAGYVYNHGSFTDKDDKSAVTIKNVDEVISKANDKMSGQVTSVKGKKSTIDSEYAVLMKLPEGSETELAGVKEAAKDAYDSYLSLFNCVILPNGNYNTWTDAFHNKDSDLSTKYQLLNNLLKAY